MKTYYVICEEVCDECGGNNVTHNPLWNDYGIFLKNLTLKTGKENPDLYRDHKKEIQNWWFDQGLEFEGEPDHLPCAECNGEGSTSCRVDLKTALQNLENV